MSLTMTAKEASALAMQEEDLSNQEGRRGLVQQLFLLHSQPLALLCKPFVFQALAWQRRDHCPIHLGLFFQSPRPWHKGYRNKQFLQMTCDM